MFAVTNAPPPTEGIKHEQPETVASMNQRELGKGTLYIADRCLYWVNKDTGEGFSIEYPHISLHAISRDFRSYPKECIYIMIDTNIDFPEGQNHEQKSSSEDEMTELRFAPDDNTALEAMFSALNECQLLHPDPQDSISEDDDEGGAGGAGVNNDDEAFIDADDDMEVEGQFNNDDEADAGFEEN